MASRPCNQLLHYRKIHQHNGNHLHLYEIKVGMLSINLIDFHKFSNILSILYKYRFHHQKIHPSSGNLHLFYLIHQCKLNMCLNYRKFYINPCIDCIKSLQNRKIHLYNHNTLLLFKNLMDKFYKLSYLNNWKDIYMCTFHKFLILQFHKILNHKNKLEVPYCYLLGKLSSFKHHTSMLHNNLRSWDILQLHFRKTHLHNRINLLLY